MSANEAVRPPPLKGVRVLDLTMFLAGPHGSQILGDLGAEVIKIEPPKGDPTRTTEPYFFAGESAYFIGSNRNKLAMTLDLTKESARSVFHDLTRGADVVFDNYRPGVTRKLGIDYPTLREVNPGIICCSISGFGQDGPYAHRPAYDMVVQALSGGMSLTGESGGRPVRSGIPIGDLCAGQAAVMAILAALFERQRSGLGTSIDISMLDVQIAMLNYIASYHFIGGLVPGPQGRGHSSIPTYASFTAGDNTDVLICANTQEMWERLCVALSRPDLARDERFATNADRLRNRAELETLLQEAFRAYRSADLLARLEEQRVPCARVNNVAEALGDPHVQYRRMVRTVTMPTGEDVKVLGNPLKFSSIGEDEFLSPPTLGQHNEFVLKDILNYDEARVRRLREDGALG